VKYSRYNFAVRHAASKHPNVPEFYRIQLEQDGCSVAADGQYVLAVGPIDAERASKFPSGDHPEVDPPPEGIGISPKLAATVDRGISSKHAALQFAQLTRCDDLRVEMMTTDAIGYTLHGDPPARRRFADWRAAVAAVRGRAGVGRVVLELNGLIRVLTAVREATRDIGKQVPLYIEFGGQDDAVVIRTHNYVGNQRVLGLATPLRLPEGMTWLEPDDWERSIGGAPSRRRRSRRMPDEQADGAGGGGGDGDAADGRTAGAPSRGGGPAEATRTGDTRLRRSRKRHARRRTRDVS